MTDMTTGDGATEATLVAIASIASDGRLPDRPGLSALAIAESVRTAATRPPVEGARLLIETALRGGPWASGAVATTGTSGALEMLVSSGPLAEHCDRLHRATGEGPAHDAIRADVVLAKDLTTEPRWSVWSPAAIDAGARAVLAVRLHAGPTFGTLTLYADRRVPGPSSGLRHIQTVAAHLSVLVLESHRRNHLERGLHTRSRVGQALGMIMLRDRVTAGEAFDRLRRISQQHNIKIADLAADLVDEGTFPVPPGYRRRTDPGEQRSG